MSHYDCPCMEKCPLHWAMSRIGGKWKVQILCSVANAGSIRYNTLRGKLDGISNTVLAAALRELERDGLVRRQAYPEVPVRVEYSPTERCGCCRCWNPCPTGPRRKWAAGRESFRNRVNFSGPGKKKLAFWRRMCIIIEQGVRRPATWACSSAGRAFGSHPYGRTSTCEFQPMISERISSGIF